MITRAVKQVQPFAFQSDFGPQPIEAAPAAAPLSQVTLSPAELAALLADARADGLAEGAARALRAEDDRLQAVTGKLNQALANLVALAGHLEAGANDSHATETALRLINATARRIIDGQGDLFAERKDISDQIAGDTPG
jgi:hypothetical protein